MNKICGAFVALLWTLFPASPALMAQAPTVVSVSPAQNNSSVPLAASITATFDRAMNPLTFNYGTFVVKSGTSGLRSGAYQYQSISNTAVFVPLQPFLPGEVITVTLTDSVRSNIGVPLSHAYSWSFTAAVYSGDRFLLDSVYPLGNFPRSLVTAHFDTDNFPDLAVADSAANSITILTGLGNGKFAAGTTYPVGSGPSEIVAYDVDKVKGIDLVIACQGSDSVSVMVNNGNSTFQPAVNYFCGARPFSLTVADLDNDPWPDIAVADYTNNRVNVLSNRGAGTFDPPKYFSVGSSGGFAPCAIAAGDVDRDGLVDLVTANFWSNNLSVLKNNGAGGFAVCASPNVGTHPQSLCVADFDGDSVLDLVTAETNPPRVEVLLNQGSCVFSSVGTVAVGGAPFCIKTADFDADSDLDLLVTSGADSACYILINNSSAQFSPNWTYKCSGNPQSICTGDFNLDGMLDLATAINNSDGVSVYLNRIFPQVVSTSPDQHQLNVDPTGDVAVTFSIAMNPTSFPGDPVALTVSGSVSGLHDGTISYDDSWKTMMFDDVDTAFHAGELVTAFLRAGVQSASHVASDSSFTWSFTVAAERGDILQDRSIYQVGAGPYEITAMDLNLDGLIDLATCNKNSNSVTLLFNRGSGGFEAQPPVSVDSFPVSIVSADFDGNGYLDLATANENSDDVSVLLNNGDGTFDDQRVFDLGDYVSPVSIASGDLNGDGRADLAVVERDIQSVSVLINRGDSTFTHVVDVAVGSNPQSVCAGDIDNDGDLDLAVANSGSDDFSVLWNNGAATFIIQTVPSVTGSVAPFCVSLADIDGNGRLGIIAADSGSSDVSILVNEGNAVFSPGGRFTVGSVPEFVTTADMNGDGRLDIVAANKLSNSISVLLNLGNGSFAPATNYTVGQRPFALTAADFDNDGDIDLASADLGTNEYFRNDSISVLYNRSFTYVTASLPQVNALSVAPSTNITIDFNHAMDTSTINDTTIFVTGSLTGAHGYAATHEDTQKQFTLNPASDFLPGEIVTIIVSDGVFSAEGYPLDTVKTWSFTASVADSGGGFAKQPTEYACGNLPWSVRLGDLDKDRNLDFVAANQISNNVSVYFGQGDGTFVAGPVYNVGTGPRGVTIADLNNDGYMDVATANFSNNSISVLLNNRDRTLAGPTAYSLDAGTGPTALVAADIDCDGDLDLATANEVSSSTTVLTNGGHGNFSSGKTSYLVGRTPRSIVAGDLDDDGHIDLVTAGADADSISVLWNNGSGTFNVRNNYILLSGGKPRSLVAADLDSDRDLDLAIVNQYKDNVSILRNSGNRTFVNAGNCEVGEQPFSIFAGDFNGDQNVDLATADYFGNTVSILLNFRGTGSFLPRYSIPLSGAMPTAVCGGDLDGDLDLDIVATGSYSGTLTVILNVFDAGSPCCIGRVADANGSGDDEPTIGDVSTMIDAKFITGSCDGIVPCVAEADINQSGGLDPICEDITIGDISILIDYLFITGPSLGLPNCF